MKHEFDYGEINDELRQNTDDSKEKGRHLN